MNMIGRIILPASSAPVFLAVFINLIVQILHFAGLFAHDGEKMAYIISGAYLVSIGLEVRAIWQERNAG